MHALVGREKADDDVLEVASGLSGTVGEAVFILAVYDASYVDALHDAGDDECAGIHSCWFVADVVKLPTGEVVGFFSALRPRRPDGQRQDDACEKLLH